MAKNGLIALRALRGRASGLVTVENGGAAFSLRGAAKGQAHLVLENGKVLSAPLKGTAGGAEAFLRAEGAILGAGVTKGTEVVLAGLNGAGSWTALLSHLEEAANRSAQVEQPPAREPLPDAERMLRAMPEPPPLTDAELMEEENIEELPAFTEADARRLIGQGMAQKQADKQQEEEPNIENLQQGEAPPCEEIAEELPAQEEETPPQEAWKEALEKERKEAHEEVVFPSSPALWAIPEREEAPPEEEEPVQERSLEEKEPEEEPPCPCELDRMERAGALAAFAAPAMPAEALRELPRRPHGERRLFFPQNDWEKQCLDALMERHPRWKPQKGRLMGVFVNAFPKEYPQVNWQIFSQQGCGHVLRCKEGGVTRYALPAQQSAKPPVGLPAGSRFCMARNRRGYWVFCSSEE